MNLISPKTAIWAPGVLALTLAVIDLFNRLSGHSDGKWSGVTGSLPFLIVFVNATTARYVNQLEDRISALEKRR